MSDDKFVIANTVCFDDFVVVVVVFISPRQRILWSERNKISK